MDACSAWRTSALEPLLKEEHPDRRQKSYPLGVKDLSTMLKGMKRQP
jgi:hypothetical protein